MTKIVDTRTPGFPLIYGLPCTSYNADEEFIFQMNLKSATIIQYTIKGRFMSR